MDLRCDEGKLSKTINHEIKFNITNRLKEYIMKYLFTGGCGFVGSNLAAEVLKRGEELFVLDNLYRFGSAESKLASTTRRFQALSL